MTYESLLKNLCEQNQDIVIMTAENKSALRNIDKLIDNNRFIDVGIAEMSLVGIASGLAQIGKKPIVHALASFLTMRAFEFIRTDVCYRKLPVKLVGSVAGFLSEANGPTHQAVEDIALMNLLPGMEIFCPADNNDMLLCLPQIIESDNPCYVRFNNYSGDFQHSAIFQPGKAEVVFTPADITIITYGFMFNEALKTVDILKSNSLSVGLINLRTLFPIDYNIILESAQKSKLLITLEDHSINNGLFSIISTILVKKRINVDVLPIAINNHWFKPALLDEVLKFEKMDAPSIAEQILLYLNK